MADAGAHGVCYEIVSTIGEEPYSDKINYWYSF